jgi:regulator of extracellular matrix RemA (YlzA/DUF370 family)
MSRDIDVEVAECIKRIIQERNELVEALEKYGRHLRSCNIHDMTSVQECDCGFSAALKRAKGEA